MYFQAYGILGKNNNLRDIAYLVKGIWDIFLFTSSDMGYWGPPIQA